MGRPRRLDRGHCRWVTRLLVVVGEAEREAEAAEEEVAAGWGAVPVYRPCVQSRHARHWANSLATASYASSCAFWFRFSSWSIEYHPEICTK